MTHFKLVKNFVGNFYSNKYISEYTFIICMQLITHLAPHTHPLATNVILWCQSAKLCYSPNF